ncbi:MAG: Fe-S cluster assembly protein HesB [Actinomycetota bacterium]
MLTLTAGAVSVIREITGQPGLSEATGVRIASAIPTGNGMPSFEIGIADAPEPADQVVETGGVRVFLDPEASDAFRDKALDAEVNEGEVRFLIADQAPE